MIKRYKHNKIHRTARTKFRIMKGSKVLYKLVARRSNKYISAQVINLKSGATVAGVKAKKASEVGTEIAKKAIKAKIKEVVFDRGAYKYHGRIKQLAESAREAGLHF